MMCVFFILNIILILYMFNNKEQYTVRIERNGGDIDSDFMNFISIRGWMMGHKREYNRFVRDGHVYYGMPHGAKYRVRMENNGGNRVNATLKIDGEEMGRWRIEPWSSIYVSRPEHSERGFVFVKEGSWEGEMGGVVKGNFVNGLVEVVFVPEKVVGDYDGVGSRGRGRGRGRSNQYFAYSNKGNGTFGAQSRMDDAMSSGATVLGEKSGQIFGIADDIDEDLSRSVVKRIRMVVENLPYVSIKSYNDPVPPRVDGMMR